MSKLIVIEGLDGSGKSTQLSLLTHYLEQQKIRFKYLHFPRLESGIFGEMVARFLRGEFGALADVDPYLVAMLYAGDRFDAAKEIQQWLDEGYLVVLDRYVHSNIAYQCAKQHTEQEVRKLHDWILNLEFNYFKIPQPSISVFLHVPFSFVKSRLEANRAGDDRDYLKGQVDIHESSMDFQQRVEAQYLRIANEVDNYKILACNDIQGQMLGADEIHKNLIELINTSLKFN